MKIKVSSPIEETPRVMQVRGMFDLAPEQISSQEWDVELPLDTKPWSIGLITGPSGCGKSTIARHLWPGLVTRGESLSWDSHRCILDDFPESLPVKRVTELLSSVGFSSPPAWLRPYQVLSTGQQFRVTVARLLAESMAWEPSKPLVVLDEFTSVVDRTVAQVGSAAIASTVRRNNLQFVAVTCHDDVEEWLNPDWVYEPTTGTFRWRLLRRRPDITLRIVRCHSSAWPLFRPHHYLSHSHSQSAVCFLATWRGRPVGFSSWLPFMGKGPPSRREHRTVCLPDFQGVGIGNALSSHIASMWAGLGFKARSTTTHPGMIASRKRSPLWEMHREPSFAGVSEGKHAHSVSRLTAGFTYVGTPMNPAQARALLGV